MTQIACYRHHSTRSLSTHLFAHFTSDILLALFLILFSQMRVSLLCIYIRKHIRENAGASDPPLLLDVETSPWNPKDFVIFLYRDFHFAEFLSRFMAICYVYYPQPRRFYKLLIGNWTGASCATMFTLHAHIFRRSWLSIDLAQRGELWRIGVVIAKSRTVPVSRFPILILLQYR